MDGYDIQIGNNCLGQSYFGVREAATDKIVSLHANYAAAARAIDNLTGKSNHDRRQTKTRTPRERWSD